MQTKQKMQPLKWLHVLTWVYFTLIFAWALAHFTLADRTWWMFVLNALSFYLFVPWLLVLPVAFKVRRPATWLATFAVLLLAVFFHGRQFVSWQVAGASAAGTPLKVMTYNVLGYNRQPQAVADAILASGADVVALQELNPRVGKAIQESLLAAYPYQLLDAQDGVFGMGIISRYPMRLTGETLPGGWVGTPQIVSITFNGQSISLVNAHVFASHPNTPQIMDAEIAAREEQARAIKYVAEHHPQPLLVTIDLNSTAQNETYRIITSTLADAWAEAGVGPGNTFPHIAPRGLRPSLPLWLIRIDYIFYSPQFHATQAQIGPWDGYSDHRPVMAWLVLKGE